MLPLQYASEDAELLLVGNKLDCEVDREITRQQGEKVRPDLTKSLVTARSEAAVMVHGSSCAEPSLVTELSFGFLFRLVSSNS